MLYVRIEEWKITERRDDAIFKTKLVRDWYIPMSKPCPKEDGDRLFVPTSDIKCYRKHELNPADILE